MFRLDLIGAEFQSAMHAQLQQLVYDQTYAHTLLCKLAGTPETVQSLVGTLYASSSGWILLSVPNALGRGAFDALNEPGVELPKKSSGNYNAHITVINPAELASIGGVDRITERGHQIAYTLGPVQTVKPAGWADIEKVWFISVHSPALERLRRSYGLSSLPNQDKHRFHITIAVRRRKILQNNSTGKGP
jgi:hypothetical protein